VLYADWPCANQNAAQYNGGIICYATTR
jgi:hypothetical protein